MSDNEAQATEPGQSEPRAEFFTLAGIAAALSTSATLGPKIYKLLHPDEPFVAHIIDSYSYKDTYVVEIELHNYDLHTLYVEAIALDEPLTLSSVNVPEVDAWDFPTGTDKDSKPALPCRIGSGGSQKLRFLLSKPPENTKYGTAKVAIARLGEKSTETKTVRFLIRGSRLTRGKLSVLLAKAWERLSKSGRKARLQ